MSKQKILSIQERAKRLSAAVVDMKASGEVSKEIIENYEKQLAEVQKDVDLIKVQYKQWRKEQRLKRLEARQ